MSFQLSVNGLFLILCVSGRRDAPVHLTLNQRWNRETFDLLIHVVIGCDCERMVWACSRMGPGRGPWSH